MFKYTIEEPLMASSIQAVYCRSNGTFKVCSHLHFCLYISFASQTLHTLFSKHCKLYMSRLLLTVVLLCNNTHEFCNAVITL